MYITMWVHLCGSQTPVPHGESDIWRYSLYSTPERKYTKTQINIFCLVHATSYQYQGIGIEILELELFSIPLRWMWWMIQYMFSVLIPRGLELKCWNWNYSRMLHIDNKCKLNVWMLCPQFQYPWQVWHNHSHIRVARSLYHRTGNFTVKIFADAPLQCVSKIVSME